jgi:hypothetical protein
MTNNSNGMVFVEMSPELAKFVIENCNSNIEVALKLMDPTGVAAGSKLDLSREALEKIVAMNEKFKMLKLATERAMR